MAKLTADPCTGLSSSSVPSKATLVLTAKATGLARARSNCSRACRSVSRRKCSLSSSNDKSVEDRCE